MLFLNDIGSSIKADFRDKGFRGKICSLKTLLTRGLGNGPGATGLCAEKQRNKLFPVNSSKIKLHRDYGLSLVMSWGYPKGAPRLPANVL